MRPWGRRLVALAGLSGTIAMLLCVAAAGFAETIKTEVELSTKEADSKESQLSDVVADAIRTSAKSDAAFIAATSFNDTTALPKGAFNSKDLLNALVHKDETIVIVKLKGEQISKALEQGLYLYPKANSAFLQLSGVVVTINPQAEAGKRVVSVKIGGDAVEAGKTYRVAMPAPLANGGLAYFKIWSKSDIEKDTDKTVEAAVTEYLSDHKTLSKGDDRLVIKGK